jgi:hypothetical protein
MTTVLTSPHLLARPMPWPAPLYCAFYQRLRARQPIWHARCARVTLIWRQVLTLQDMDLLLEE